MRSGRKTEYFVTNTITKCDFLISMPVAKVHENCGVTCCFKNYVGTGPRIAYEMELYDQAALLRAVREAKAAADLVVFTIHAHESPTGLDDDSAELVLVL